MSGGGRPGAVKSPSRSAPNCGSGVPRGSPQPSPFPGRRCAGSGLDVSLDSGGIPDRDRRGSRQSGLPVRPLAERHPDLARPERTDRHGPAPDAGGSPARRHRGRGVGSFAAWNRRLRPLGVSGASASGSSEQPCSPDWCSSLRRCLCTTPGVLGRERVPIPESRRQRRRPASRSSRRASARMPAYTVHRVELQPAAQREHTDQRHSSRPRNRRWPDVCVANQQRRGDPDDPGRWYVRVPGVHQPGDLGCPT